MNYFGRLFSNFRDFYNEINSATLTGAIDVIVVQQPDGSYLCSPFHVRFGKMGVLRSREKIVDIGLNGEPVDIHMKLGDTGEAFFVEEVEEEEEEIPSYLATSPLPDETYQDYLPEDPKREGVTLEPTTLPDHIHPYSDGEITPFACGSPQDKPKLSSRPPSPLSDSEYEITKSDVNSQTELATEHGVSWQWGEMPHVPRKVIANTSSKFDRYDSISPPSPEDEVTLIEKSTEAVAAKELVSPQTSLTTSSEYVLIDVNTAPKEPLCLENGLRHDVLELKEENNYLSGSEDDFNVTAVSEPVNIESSTSSRSNRKPPNIRKRKKRHYRKALRLSSEQIVSLNLQEGANELVFSVTTAYQGTTRCQCQMYFWCYDDKIIISDIDGTITKSDVLGHILPILGRDWAQSGVANLFTKIYNNSYKLLYLSARAIGQAGTTRDYLRSVRQGDLCLPDGPLLLSPTSLISAFHREVIEKKPEEFKISCLKDIQALFPTNPFYAGFGNKINDTWAYRAVDIPLSRIFTVNHRGELKLELIQTFQSSYTRLSDVVDQMFPPLEYAERRADFLSEYSSFNYWREPISAVELDDELIASVISSVTNPTKAAKSSQIKQQTKLSP